MSRCWFYGCLRSNHYITLFRPIYFIIPYHLWQCLIFGVDRGGFSRPTRQEVGETRQSWDGRRTKDLKLELKLKVWSPSDWNRIEIRNSVVDRKRELRRLVVGCRSREPTYFLTHSLTYLRDDKKSWSHTLIRKRRKEGTKRRRQEGKKRRIYAYSFFIWET